MKHICIVIAGHISTCPRMRKCADALASEGYKVSLVGAQYLDWATESDKSIIRTVPWTPDLYSYQRSTSFFNYLKTATIYRWRNRFKQDWNSSDPRRAGAHITRAFNSLLNKAIATRADFFLGGTSGGILLASEAAKALGVRFALDIEDWHPDESDDKQVATVERQVLLKKVMSDLLPKATFVTTGSDIIRDLCDHTFGIRSQVINNVFSISKSAPSFTSTPAGSLSLYWFSQRIGPYRGIEMVVEAACRTTCSIDFHLRGACDTEYRNRLIAMVGDNQNVKLRFSLPSNSDDMVELAEPHEVGLAVEVGESINRQACLANKPFIYLAAGLATVFTETRGQLVLRRQLGSGCESCVVGDVSRLSEILNHWALNKAQLMNVRKLGYHAACTRWNWDHEAEKGKLLNLVRESLA